MIFGINFLLALINISDTKKVQRLLYISFIILSLFLCFNYTNGIDWTQYQKNFLQVLKLNEIIETRNYYANIPERNRGELLFYYLMSTFKMLGFNYEMYQFITLTIVMYIMYKTISKFSEYSLVGISIYFSYFMIGNFFEPIFRQFLAMSLFYLAIIDIKNRDFFKYLFKILLAYFLHSSSILLILCYFIPQKKINIKLLVIIFSVLMGVDKYLEVFLNNLGNLVPIINKYLVYFEIEEYGLEDSINLVFFIKILFSIIIGVYVEKNKQYLSMKNNQMFYIALNFYWINEIFFILKRQMVIFYRLQYYFEIFYVIIITFLIKILIKKYNKKIGVILFLIFSMFYYRILYISITSWKEEDSMKFYPYTNYIIEKIFNQEIKEGYEKINYRLKMRRKSLS